jgi:hypothetical protein
MGVFRCDLSEKPLKNLAKASDFQSEHAVRRARELGMTISPSALPDTQCLRGMIRRVALRGVATQGIALAGADMILSGELGVRKAAARPV